MYWSSGISDAKEADANRLAADILMPRRIIRRLLDQGVIDPNDMTSKRSPLARIVIFEVFGSLRYCSFSGF